MSRGDSVEQGLRHTYEFRVSNGVYGVPPGRAGDDVEFTNGVPLSVLSKNGDTAAFFFRYGTQTAVDDDVEAVADVVRTPEHLPGVDLYPIERTIDMEH